MIKPNTAKIIRIYFSCRIDKNDGKLSLTFTRSNPIEVSIPKIETNNNSQRLFSILSIFIWHEVIKEYLVLVIRDVGLFLDGRPDVTEVAERAGGFKADDSVVLKE